MYVRIQDKNRDVFVHKNVRTYSNGFVKTMRPYQDDLLLCDLGAFLPDLLFGGYEKTCNFSFIFFGFGLNSFRRDWYLLLFRTVSDSSSRDKYLLCLSALQIWERFI